MKRFVNLLYLIGFPLAFIGVWLKDETLGWVSLACLVTGVVIELVIWARKNHIF